MIQRHVPTKTEAGVRATRVSPDRHICTALRGFTFGRPARGPKHARPAPRRKED